MFRRWHSLTGMILGLVLIVTSLSGAILAVEPTLDRIANPSIPGGVSVAALAEQVAARHQSINRIVVRPNGAVTVSYADGEESGVERVDPATGAGLGPYTNSEFSLFVTNLHRAFLAGDAGRDVTAVSAVAILALSLSGLFLLARRQGGWKRLLHPAQGGGAHRLHAEIARVAVAGLLLLSVTGVWLSADWLGLLPAPARTEMATATGGTPAPIGALDALQAVDLRAFKELSFPSPTDPEDVFTLKTRDGEAQIDPATGAVLTFAPATLLDRTQELMKTLHTGRGLWVLGLLLGLSSAAVPVLAASGALVWLRRRKGAGATSAATDHPSTVILVGSESNVTWGFAHALDAALTQQGVVTHVKAMNDVAPADLQAQRLLILTSTYGEGDAPTSASEFLTRLKAMDGRASFAVLGFGDRRFRQYCGYAEKVADDLLSRGWKPVLPLTRIDRQSSEAFARWGEDLGSALGIALRLEHVAERPRRKRVRSTVTTSDIPNDASPAAIPVRVRQGERRVG